MNAGRAVFAAAFFCLAAFPHSAPAQEAAGPLPRRMPIAVGEWAPFTGEALPSKGMLCTVATEAFRRLGVEVDYKFYPWTRNLAVLKAGDAWGSFAWFLTPERRNDFDFVEEPLYVSKGYLFYSRANPRIPPGLDYAALSDLKGYRFGGARGYFYERVFAEGGYDAVLADSIENAFRMLEAGRVDFIIEGASSAADLERRLFPGRTGLFGHLPRPYTEDPMFVLVSRAYPGREAVSSRFSRELALMKADGSYRRILDSYPGQ